MSKANLLERRSVVSGLLTERKDAIVVGGLGALGAGLFSIGIPKNSVLEYETAVKSDKFVLIVHGTAAEVAKAKEVLDTTKPARLDLHSQEELAAAR